MGYSCTAAANTTLEKIIKECRKQTGSQNVFKHTKKGYTPKKYLFEIGKETRDGSIVGQIHEWNGVTVGDFRIDPEGKITKGATYLQPLIDADKPKVKKEQFTLQKYRYQNMLGMINKHPTGKPGEIIFVDLANKHPDPSKQLIWGYGEDGTHRGGDFARFFEKVGKPQTFEFEQTGRYRSEEIKVRQDAIRRAIKKGW